MSAFEVVTEAYKMAKRADHRKLRALLTDDATWEPSEKKKWNACRDPDQVVRTMLWRAGSANHMRPSEPMEFGQYAVYRLRGRRLERLGARGFWIPKLYQVAEVKAGKIARMRDYGTLTEALAGTGHDS